MMLYKSFIIFIITTGTFAHNVPINFTPCCVDDTSCFGTMLTNFLEVTHKGIPFLGIKQFDPVTIPSLDICLHDNAETILYNKNLIISGLKDQVFRDYKMNLEGKSVILEMQVHPTIASTTTVEFKKFSKSFCGTASMKGPATIRTSCNFDFITDKFGIEHINYGPETMECRVLDKLEVTVSPELQEAINKAECLYKRKINDIFCNILKKAYATVISDIRELAKVLPKTEIIKELKTANL